jgi:peptide deformylase
MSEIVTFGHPALTAKSSNIEQIDDYIVSLSKKMINIMYEAPGVGLAAPQIGINKNIFVFDAGEGPKVAINPKIEDLQGNIIFMEGCLSLPGYYWDIERYEYAKLSCLNENGEEIIYEGEELLGRVLQHEYDHLQGNLLLKKLKRKIRKEALKEISIKGFPGDKI